MPILNSVSAGCKTRSRRQFPRYFFQRVDTSTDRGATQAARIGDRRIARGAKLESKTKKVPPKSVSPFGLKVHTRLVDFWFPVSCRKRWEPFATRRRWRLHKVGGFRLDINADCDERSAAPDRAPASPCSEVSHRGRHAPGLAARAIARISSRRAGSMLRTCRVMPVPVSARVMVVRIRR